MERTRLPRLVVAILITFFILGSFHITSASALPGGERIGSSWFCGVKSRKLGGDCWRHLRFIKDRSAREVVVTPPSPQFNHAPPH